MIESEAKIKVAASLARRRLEGIGARFLHTQRQVDVYFQHPCRDLFRRDEALRIRKTGNGSRLTYKGPRAEGCIKIREEIEVAVGSEMAILLEHLGFRRIATVVKERTLYTYGRLLCALDKVEKLGEFLEIETLQPENTKDITELLVKLGLAKEPLLRNSYLELLEEINKWQKKSLDV